MKTVMHKKNSLLLVFLMMGGQSAQAGFDYIKGSSLVRAVEVAAFGVIAWRVVTLEKKMCCLQAKITELESSLGCSETGLPCREVNLGDSLSNRIVTPSDERTIGSPTPEPYKK